MSTDGNGNQSRQSPSSLPGPVLTKLTSFLDANDLLNLERSGFFGNHPSRQSEDVDLMFNQMSHFKLIIFSNLRENLINAQKTLLRCGRKLVDFEILDQNHENVTGQVCMSTGDFFKRLASTSPNIEKFDHTQLYFHCLPGIVDYLKTVGKKIMSTSLFNTWTRIFKRHSF